MAKKRSPSSPPGQMVSVNSEDVLKKPLTKRQEAVVKKLAVRQAAGDDSHIDFSDIPELTEGQLAKSSRPRERN